MLRGFIGRRVHGLLSDAGHVVDASDMNSIDGVLALRDRATGALWIAEARPEIVAHSGAISGPMVAPDDSALVFEVNAVGELVRRRLPRLTVVADPAQPGGDGDFGPLDMTAAKRLIGYEPGIALDEGLRRLIEADTD